MPMQMWALCRIFLLYIYTYLAMCLISCSQICAYALGTKLAYLRVLIPKLTLQRLNLECMYVHVRVCDGIVILSVFADSAGVPKQRPGLLHVRLLRLHSGRARSRTSGGAHR